VARAGDGSHDPEQPQDGTIDGRSPERAQTPLKKYRQVLRKLEQSDLKSTKLSKFSDPNLSEEVAEISKSMK
jgi:hypothetical protein